MPISRIMLDMPRRLLQLYAGLILYGASLALQIRASLGLDPWDVFHQGLSEKTGLSFGTIVIIIGALVLLAWIPLRQKPGIGTISQRLRRRPRGRRDARDPARGRTASSSSSRCSRPASSSTASPARPTSARASAPARATA